MRCSKNSLGALVLAVTWALGAVGQTAATAPESDGNPAAALETPAIEDGAQTAPPDWNKDAAVHVEKEAPLLPMDPKLAEVNAELDRMSGAASTGGAPVPTARRVGMGVDSVLRALFWLCIIIALILVSAYLLKRFGRRTPFLAGADLGALLGKLYLSPRASLHFVRTGGRVLVIGVTQNNVSLVSEFDAAAFEAVLAADRTDGAGETEERPTDEPDPGAKPPANFLAHLRAGAGSLLREAPAPQVVQPPAHSPDADIDSLRNDIARLQKYLKENLREE